MTLAGVDKEVLSGKKGKNTSLEGFAFPATIGLDENSPISLCGKLFIEYELMESLMAEGEGADEERDEEADDSTWK